MIKRTLKEELTARLFKGKAILLTGPRQVGKTTLVRQILEATGKVYQFFDGDDPVVRQLLDQPNTEELRQIIGKPSLVFVDEAQRIPQIGLTAKIITDQFR